MEFNHGFNYRQVVERFLDDNDYNLYERLPKGIYRTINKATGVPFEYIKDIIRSIRVERKINAKVDPRISFLSYNIFVEFCIAHGLLRGSNKEGIVCKTIIHFLPQLPLCGHGLIIGTATPICVFNNSKYGNYLIIDNLQVAIALNDTTDHLSISVGSGVNQTKAKIKVDLWKRLSPFTKANIIMETVDRKSYAWRVENLAKKAMRENTVAKVILLTSGVWAGSKNTLRKYGLDLNFKSPSKNLTLIYPNLHILAIVRTNRSVFEVMYIHNGTERFIDA